MYEFLAELTVLFHFLFVLYVLFGGLLLFRWFKLIWLHMLAMLWGFYILFTATLCPLTPLEKWFRMQADLETYEGGFISHYLIPLLYPDNLGAPLRLVATVVLLSVNFVVYFSLYRSRHHHYDNQVK